MSIVFGEYELVASSGWFDPDYYVQDNPDVASSNIDPLMHYLEWGAKESRNPSARFDAADYLAQCDALGPRPANALVHYLNIGRDQGLTPRPVDAVVIEVEPEAVSEDATAPIASEVLLSIDAPRIVEGRVEISSLGGLSIAGWALSQQGAVKIDVAIDGHVAVGATCGIRRPDVMAEYRGWHNALLSGFAAHVPPRLLTDGRHAVVVTARDRQGGSVSREFAIDMKTLAADRGPGSLRRTMPESEVRVKLAVLAALKECPSFHVVIQSAGVPVEDFAAMRRTLASLNGQTYPHWTLSVQSQSRSDEMWALFDNCSTRLAVRTDELKQKTRAKRKRVGSLAERRLTLILEVGDELGCDALLELALAGGLHRHADFIYGDDRRVSAVDGKMQAFFKPDWSPDLLTSTNYLGRSWCAANELFAAAGVDSATADIAGYDRVLKLTEVAKSIVHVPKVLFQQSEEPLDPSAAEETALTALLARRDIVGHIVPGLTTAHHRLQRKVRNSERVSIIVPIGETGGLARTCIESLRDVTARVDYEVICIDHTPKAERRRSARWLAGQSATVISSEEAFNWSRFNNVGAAAASGAYLLFLHDDVEIMEPEWLEALLEHAQRPEVGVVGPQLLYPDRRVQHAGITLDAKGRGRHVFRYQQQRDPGYFGLGLTQRNVIGVSGACLLTRREAFERLGRFDEAYALINGDLDYCLRSWAAGFANLYTPYSRLIHHERGSLHSLEDLAEGPVLTQKWAAAIESGDPFSNPHLIVDLDQFMVEREPTQEVYSATPLYLRASIQRILVMKLDSTADCIAAIPAVRRLKQAFPAARLTVLAVQATHPLWQAEPCVDETLVIADTEFDDSANRLRERRFDLAIDLHKHPETRQSLRMSGARILCGFDAQGRFPWLDVALEWEEDVPLKSKRTHVSTDLMALVDLVASCGDSPPIAPVAEGPPPTLSGPDARDLWEKPLVCLHVFADAETQQWPLERFSRLIARLLDTQPVNMALVGDSEDPVAVEKFIAPFAQRGGLFNLVGQIAPEQWPELLVRSALFIGNDSGPLHLAAHLGVPTVGIHSGVLDAREWGPSGRLAVAVRRQMTCSPCFITHAKDCPRALACLTDLSVREVFTTVVRLLACKVEVARDERSMIRGIARV